MVTENTRHPIDELAEDYLARLRQGEHPSIDEYAERNPNLAEEIRDLFPALKLLEQGKPHDDELPTIIPFGPGSAIPQLLGDYCLLREIGRGGMGVVYEAEQLSLGRHVALKILPPNITRDANNLMRFRREARSAARLHHTNIVPVFEIGHWEGIHYYAMQFIQGQGLDRVIVELVKVRRQEQAVTQQRHTGGAGQIIRTRPAADNRMATDEPRHQSGVAALTSVLAGQLISGQFSPSSTGIHDIANAEERELVPPTQPCDGNPGDAEGGECGRQPAVHHALTEHGFARGGSRACYFDSVVRIGVQVADALTYAHAQGVLHRDIKPSNLLLDVHGTVWLTDFGLAKDDRSDLTKTGDVVGTLRYMAPERFQGVTDARSDVYSLGLTLYEMLTLRPAVEPGSLTPSQWSGCTRPGPPHPRTIDTHIPRDLETVVLKAIAPEPVNRYLHAGDLAEDLRRFLARLPIHARRQTWLETSWMWCRRNPHLSLLAGISAMLFLLACVGGVASHFLRQERDLAVQARENARRAERVAERAQLNATVREHLSQAATYRISGRPGSRERALEELRQAVRLRPSPSLRSVLRDLAVAALTMTDVHTEFVPWNEFSSPDGSFLSFGNKLRHALSSDLGRCAVADLERNVIVVCDMKNRRVERRFAAPAWAADAGLATLRFSRSGAHLAVSTFMEGGRLELWDVATGTRLDAREKCHGFALSPDDNWLAVSCETAGLQLVSLKDPSFVRNIEMAEVAQGLAYSPDGRQLAVCYGARRPVVSIFDAGSLRLIDELQVGTPGAVHVTWHPGGSQLIVARGAARRGELWDLARRRKVAETGDHQSYVAACEVHPQGDLLTTWSWDGAARLWDIYSGRLVLILEHGLTGGWSQTGSVAGSRVSDVGMELLCLDRGRVFRQLEGPFDQFYLQASFSPDGQLVAARFGPAYSFGTGFAIWHVETGRQLARVNADQISALKFSVDGRRLLMVHKLGLSVLPLDRDETGRLTIGPPQTDENMRATHGADISADGSVCAVIHDGVLRAGMIDSNQVTQFDLPRRHDHVEVSDDGCWAATGGWHSPVTSVWDLVEGKLAKEFHLGAQTGFAFLPGGAQFVTARSDAYHVWDLTTWRDTLQLARTDCPHPGIFATAPHGKEALVSLSPHGIHLVRLLGGETMFQLRRPNQHQAGFCCFSPDASQVLECNITDNLIGIWDLKSLDQQLEALGIHPTDSAWVATAAAPRKAVEPSVVPELTVIGLEDWKRLSFIGSMPRDQAQRELETSAQRLVSDPASAAAANELAWSLLMAPVDLRDPQRALSLARQAVQTSPTEANYGNTLGAAYFRTGDYARAIEVLEKNLVLTEDANLPWDLFFLSMSHAAAGNRQHAAIYFNLANRWVQDHEHHEFPLDESHRVELEAIQAEAQTLFSRQLADHD